MYKCLCERVFSVLSGMYLGVELLVQMRTPCLTFKELKSLQLTARHFFRSLETFFLSFCLFLSCSHGISHGICQSHSNAGSKLHLQPTAQLMATPDP